MRPFFLFLLLLISSTPAFSQGLNYVKIENLNETYKPITHDSVIFYFDHSWRMVRPECAQFIRYTKVTPDAFFTGVFRDYSQDSTLLTIGHYENQLKHGLFQEFHTNGNPKAEGEYKENQRVGQWKTYYEDGSPQYVFYYKQNALLLVSAWEQQGLQTVKDGTGIVKETKSQGVLKGAVKDSLMVGKWTNSLTSGMVMFQEEFKAGKFQSGIYPNAPASSNKYKDGSKIEFFQPSSFINAEAFKFINECYKAYPPKASVSLTLPSYHKDPTWVAKVLVNKFKTSRAAAPLLEKKAIISFSFVVDENGHIRKVELDPKDQTLYLDIVPIVEEALLSLGRWKPATKAEKPISFKMKLTVEIRDTMIGVRYNHSGPVEESKQ